MREHTHIQDQAEIWKAIPGYEGFYEVSDQGRVRSLDRIVPASNGTSRRLRGKIKAPQTGAEGYLMVTLYRGSEGRTMTVHRIVMNTFAGPRPEGMERCHNNGDRTDNRLANLRYDTRSENMFDTVRHGTNDRKNRTHCPRGHALTPINTPPHRIKQGTRTCLACERARNRIRRHPELADDLEQIADSYFEDIIRQSERTA